MPIERATFTPPPSAVTTAPAESHCRTAKSAARAPGCRWPPRATSRSFGNPTWRPCRSHDGRIVRSGIFSSTPIGNRSGLVSNSRLSAKISRAAVRIVEIATREFVERIAVD